jgi:23S rRNA pseudouridine1911/1915/1917 synthase
LVVVIASTVSADRADKILSAAHPELSRRIVQKLCERGRVSVAGHRLAKSDLLRPGDSVRIELDPARVASPNPDLALVIRFESPQWLVVAKPALQPSAPKNAADRGTLANALLARFPELAEIGHSPLEPGLLHRLDNGTSGLLVAARNQSAFDAAAAALASGSWVKQYLALVQQAENLPQAGCIQGRLAASRRSPHRVVLDRESSLQMVRDADDTRALDLPKPSQREGSRTHATHFRIKSRLATATLVEVTVSAAFRHQIRAHFALVGCPLLNDEVYGAARDRRLAPGRHALHAARVAWAGASGLLGFDVFEPLPEDLATCLDERSMAVR